MHTRFVLYTITRLFLTKFIYITRLFRLTLLCVLSVQLFRSNSYDFV